jgi:hypothetical protein
MYSFAGFMALGMVLIFGTSSSCSDEVSPSMVILKYYTMALIMIHVVSSFAAVYLCLMICICLPCILIMMRFVKPPNEGLNDTQIKAIPETRFIAASNNINGCDVSCPANTCVICQVDYVDGVKLKHLRCSHDFHSDCLHQWLVLKRTCPLCRASVGFDHVEPVEESARPSMAESR